MWSIRISLLRIYIVVVVVVVVVVENVFLC